MQNKKMPAKLEALLKKVPTTEKQGATTVTKISGQSWTFSIKRL